MKLEGRAPRALAGLALAAIAVVASPAPARGDAAPVKWGNLEVLKQGELRYRWVRNGLSLELRDRNGHWTDAEAIAIRDGLDKLPDLYVRKAIKGGVKKLLRDGKLPSAPWQFVAPPSNHLKAVAVPPGPWNYVSLGDLAFQTADGDAQRPYRIITHELGHCIMWSISGWASYVTGIPGYTSISFVTALPTGWFRSWNGYVSNYARTNHSEDFADSCTFYWLAPDELLKANPAKFRYIRDRIFEGLVSPPWARVDDRRDTDLVHPSITSLGDTEDTQHSLVKVHGEHFMGPLDGGFNRVEYRGTKALHLPISRTTIWSWVPGLSPGSAPITVTTQDGKSDPAAFNVRKKPWWQFW